MRTFARYSPRFVEEIRAIARAHPEKLGVQLCMACIAAGVPVTDVADYIGISRTTVYSWFRGSTEVPRKHEAIVHKLHREVASLNDI